MIDYTYRSLFHNSSVDKQWTITDGEITLTNSDIYSEKINIEESLCSCSQQGNITFGSCESNMISFTTTCLTQMVGRRITVSVTLEGGELEPFVLGTYTVVEDTLTADRQKREIIAYDDLYTINNANVADWYDSLIFPLTLKQFRDSFFTHFNITQETTNLPNDSVMVEKTVEAEVLSGALVIQSICELNGRCGHIGRDGVFRYIPLYNASVSSIPVSEYEKIEYADYQVLAIDKVQIRQEEADIGAIVGTGTNAYIVEDNFLVYGKNATDLNTIATNLFAEIDGTVYTPISIDCIADPCVEVGDAVNITMVNGNTLFSYVMNRRITGLQSLKDSISSSGEEYQKEQLNTVNSEMIQLKGKATKIEKSVDGITTTVINDVLDPDNPQSLTSQINQAASEISAKVDEVHGDIHSSFSWELLSTGFDVKSNGTSVFRVDSSGAEITGNVKAESGYIGDATDGFNISSSSIYNGITSMSDTSHEGVYVGTNGIHLRGSNERIVLQSPQPSASDAETEISGASIGCSGNGLWSRVYNSGISVSKDTSMFPLAEVKLNSSGTSGEIYVTDTNSDNSTTISNTRIESYGSTTPVWRYNNTVAGDQDLMHPNKSGTIAVTSDIKNATLTIQKNGSTVSTFSANASSNVTCNITCENKISYVNSGNWRYWKDSAGWYHAYYLNNNASINFNGSIGNLKYRTTTWDITLPVTISAMRNAQVTLVCGNDIVGGCIQSYNTTTIKLWLWAAQSGTKTCQIFVQCDMW